MTTDDSMCCTPNYSGYGRCTSSDVKEYGLLCTYYLFSMHESISFNVYDMIFVSESKTLYCIKVCEQCLRFIYKCIRLMEVSCNNDRAWEIIPADKIYLYRIL